MKFAVTRTSTNGQPCEEAVLEEYIRIDEYDADNPEKVGINPRNTSWWYDRGENHRVENGHIKRDFRTTGWFIEINSLDDLIAFKNKYGSLVIEDDPYNRNQFARIEIYDDYRE